MKLRIFALAALMVLLVSISAVSAQEGTVAETLTASEDLSTLVSLIDAAGIADALSAGDITIFAPTNEAFAELPQVVLDYFGSGVGAETLAQLLMYHVVSGAMTPTESVMVASMDMGNELNIVVDDMGISVDQAYVIETIEASDGTIHMIDSVLIPPITLPSVNPLAVSANIIAAGSSTVFPLTERMADLFNQDGFAGTITVDSIGSGAGYERFCVNAETDISNASRPIRPEEVESCRSNGREPVRFFVAIDALAVTVSRENDFVDSLTFEELALAFSGEAAAWSDINPDWPAEQIRLFSPGSDSGTYDYFVEEIFDSNEEPIQNAPGIQFSEDDNVLVLGVEGSPYAIGYFGFAYFQENQGLLRAIPIEGVEPNEETGITGEYPLSRPLFIYTSPNIVEEKPQVAEFINYYLQNANSQLGPAANQIGYIPTGEFVGRLNALSFVALTSGM